MVVGRDKTPENPVIGYPNNMAYHAGLHADREN